MKVEVYNENRPMPEPVARLRLMLTLYAKTPVLCLVNEDGTLIEKDHTLMGFSVNSKGHLIFHRMSNPSKEIVGPYDLIQGD